MSENEFDIVAEAFQAILKGKLVTLQVAEKALKHYRTKTFNASLRKVDDKSIAENGTEEHDESDTAETEFVHNVVLEKLKTENKNLLAKLERTQNTMTAKDEKIKKFEREHGMESERLREENIKLKKEIPSSFKKTSHKASTSLNVEDEVKSDTSETGSVHIEMLKIENEKLKAQALQTENSLAIKNEQIKEFERKQGILIKEQGMLIKEKEETQRTCERLREENSKLKNEVSSLNDIISQKISRSLKTEDKDNETSSDCIA